MIRRIALAAVAAGIALGAASCEGLQKKERKRDKVKLPGETDSEMSWNRPTSATQVGSPLGLPTSR